MTTRPAVYLLISAGAPSNIGDACCLGCEEEGVPLVRHFATGNAESLARSGATESDLFVGVGIDASGTIVVHEQRLGTRPPVIVVQHCDEATARLLGGDAARLVLGRRLRSV